MGISFRARRRHRRTPGVRPTSLEKIGRAVLRLRLWYGWSQATLESRSGVDQTTISRLERGRHPGINIKVLSKVLDALNVGDVAFDHPPLVSEQTPLEIMLHGDIWARACREADRRLDWPKQPGSA
jgi:transcriptional regulator with XRE-family HTH domain